MTQRAARETSGNIERHGWSIVEESRGESAFVVDIGDRYLATVIEGLGTKNLVADSIRKQRVNAQTEIASAIREDTGRTHYDGIAQDTVAMIVNDLIVVGADPAIVNAYCAVGDSEWFRDFQRAEDLVKGWQRACDLAGATWGGGETPALKGVINPDTIDLAGSALGVIHPKERLTLGEKLVEGDAIFLVESSGIHANGLSLAREVAEKLPEKYLTPLSDGKTFGESLLTPTYIYAGLVRDLFEAGIDIHYMANITGHGWRKLMRANRELSYVIEHVPQPHAVFEFLQSKTGNDDAKMYETFNMGAGFAIFMNDEYITKAQMIAKNNYDWQSGKAGYVEKGPRQVVIEPKEITFDRASLGVR